MPAAENLPGGSAHVSASFISPAGTAPLLVKFSPPAAVRDPDEAPTSCTSFVATSLICWAVREFRMTCRLGLFHGFSIKAR